jgi:hypothetical protein
MEQEDGKNGSGRDISDGRFAILFAPAGEVYRLMHHSLKYIQSLADIVRIS